VIAIRKGEAPPSLIRDGEKHVKELCAAYDADPDTYRTGKATMEFRESIYQAAPVKTALEDSHGGKCCYCEIVIPTPHAHSHVEHWRPKRSPRQSRRAPCEPPGYYWLAYEWDNLLLSCFVCNRSKGDLFPIKDPATRVRDHRITLENESPTILKPDRDNPRRHIKFDKDVPVGITDEGKETIKVLGLDSVKHSLRRKCLAKIREYRNDFDQLKDSDDPAAREVAKRRRQKVEDAALPGALYSAMIAAYLEANPLPARTALTGGVAQTFD
jgi:uncharacterized protein (TIGR02646 family)